MKKILVLASAMFLGFAAQSAVTWDWWFGNASTSNKGCALGLGAANAEITGAQVAIKMLIDRGADVNATDNQGNTALDIAREQRLDAIVDLLRAAGGH